MGETKNVASHRLLQVLKSRAGVNLAECFQCQKCSAGCTIADDTDLLPHALIKMVQVGREDDVLRSSHIWLCVSCETCSTRCPNQIDLCGIIDTLRQIAMEQGIEPAEPEVTTFHQAVLETVKRHGRMYELGMIARLKLRTGNYFKDAGMGIDLIRRGKISFFPSNVKGKDEVAALFDRRADRGRQKG